MKSERIHAAYNITTGEVLTATTNSALKAAVRRTHYLDLQGYEIESKWMFAHGRDYGEKIHNRLVKKYGECW